MAITYMEVVNDVLSEMNEVLLTSSNFANATNIQRSVKEFVNRAYMDINNPNFKWPWLAVNESQNDFYGNTYVETVAGQRWYDLNPSATDINDSYGHVDWDHFSLTEEGVAGKSAPYTARSLPYVEIQEWRDMWAVSEEVNKYNTSSRTTPKRIFREPNGLRFGVSPIPDGIYRVYFYAWNRPVALENYDSVVALPDQYKSVLLARSRYYAWQRKENANQAAIAAEEYKDLLKGMRQQETAPTPDRFTDNRVRFV